MPSVLLYGSEARSTKQDDEKHLQAFHMMAQRRVLNSVREQTKLVDLPLVIADRTRAILGHIIRLPEDYRLQHVINITNGSHLAAGWKHPPGGPWKTRLQQVIADQDCDIDVIWSQVHDHSTWRSLRPSLVRRISE